jgi:hypothetical protein
MVPSSEAEDNKFGKTGLTRTEFTSCACVFASIALTNHTLMSLSKECNRTALSAEPEQTNPCFDHDTPKTGRVPPENTHSERSHLPLDGLRQLRIDPSSLPETKHSP